MAVDKKLDTAKTADSYPLPEADPTYEEKRTPGPVARGLSKALMQGAFSKFGQAFTDTGNVRKDAATRESRLAPFIEAGSQVASALEGRWHQMEMDNFQNEVVEPYIQQKKMMLDDYQRRHAMAAEGIFEGPDGLPMPVDITTKEGRMQAIRMTNALVKRFYSIGTDQDLEFQNEVAKWESNPLIKQRGLNVQQAASAVLTQNTNPEQALKAAEAESVIRARETLGEAQLIEAKARVTAAKEKKRPKSLKEAKEKHGAEGIVQWFISDPDGLALLNSEGGGAAFLTEEKKLVEGALMAKYPHLDADSPELESKVQAQQGKWVRNGAIKYIESLDPALVEEIRQTNPHFFREEGPKDAAVVNDERMDPKVRDRHVTTWKKHAETHFNEYMANPNNDPSIEAAMSDLDTWLRAAVYGDTEEAHLAAVTAARGPGTTKYVEQVLEDVPKYIRKWWPKGSGVGREENVEEAHTQELLSGKFGPRGIRMGLRRARKAKEDDGGLNLP